MPSLFRYVVVLPNHPCRWSSPLAWIIWRLWRAPFCFCIFWQVALVRWNEAKFANQNWSIDTSESVEHLHLLMRKKCRTVCRTQPQISTDRWISCISCVKAAVVAVAKTASTPTSGPRYQVLPVVAPWEQSKHPCHDVVPQLAHLSAEEGEGCSTKLLGYKVVTQVSNLKYDVLDVLYLPWRSRRVSCPASTLLWQHRRQHGAPADQALNTTLFLMHMTPTVHATSMSVW